MDHNFCSDNEYIHPLCSSKLSSNHMVLFNTAVSIGCKDPTDFLDLCLQWLIISEGIWPWCVLIHPKTRANNSVSVKPPLLGVDPSVLFLRRSYQSVSIFHIFFRDIFWLTIIQAQVSILCCLHSLCLWPVGFCFCSDPAFPMCPLTGGAMQWQRREDCGQPQCSLR